MKQTNQPLLQPKITNLWLIVVPWGAIIVLTTVGVWARTLLGLSNPISSGGPFELLVLVLYTICWIVFFVVGNLKQNFWKYFPWSVLVYYLAVVATGLLPR